MNKSNFRTEKPPTCRFVAYVNETDNGCDYTIACGKKLIPLYAETTTEAVAELKQYYRDRAWPDGFVSLTLYDVRDVYEAPLDEWRGDLVREEQEAVIREEENRARAQYESLKARFGK
jgi:hypothetical protein